MLKFINDNDFLLVDKYMQSDDGSVSWIYNDGNVTHSGFLREGMTRINGEDVIDIWESLMSMVESGKIEIKSEDKEPINEVNLRLRKQAYKSESDPLFIESQYDKTDESEKAWRDKVEDIKNRYPI